MNEISVSQTFKANYSLDTRFFDIAPIILNLMYLYFIDYWTHYWQLIIVRGTDKAKLQLFNIVLSAFSFCYDVRDDYYG